VGRSYSFVQILNGVVEFALYLLVRTKNFAGWGLWSHTFVARIDDIDVSEPFEWKVESLEGAEVTEDMVVLGQRLQHDSEVPRSLNWVTVAMHNAEWDLPGINLPPPAPDLS
jgi:hypothetical protein